MRLSCIILIVHRAAIRKWHTNKVHALTDEGNYNFMTVTHIQNKSDEYKEKGSEVSEVL